MNKKNQAENTETDVEVYENMEQAVESKPLGKPLIFKSPEELQAKIDQYFESCYRKVIDPETHEESYENTRPLTISGLAVALGCSRRTLLNYEQRDNYFLTIKKARERIENYVEESLWQPKITAGVIFNLKNNFGWVDKSEVETTIKIADRLEDYFK